MKAILSAKRVLIEHLLGEVDYLLMVINPQATGVKLPDYLIEAAKPVGINIGYRMAIPVADLQITEWGISGTLSFNRTPYFCNFPWRAIVQVSVGDEHVIWLSPGTTSPKDIDPASPGQTEKPKGDGDAASENSKPRHLRLVK